MKEPIKTLGIMVAAGVGWMFAFWLWDNVLEEKADKVKDYFDDKRKKKGA